MADSKWEDARRLEAWAGEIRVNLIRAVALVLFYGNHLFNLYFYRDDPSLQGETGATLHANITTIVLAWAIGIVALHAFLTRRWMPPALMYVSTAWDLPAADHRPGRSQCRWPAQPADALVLRHRRGGPAAPVAAAGVCHHGGGVGGGANRAGPVRVHTSAWRAEGELL